MRTIATIMGFFILAQIIGIFTGTVIYHDINKNPYVNQLVVTTNTGNLWNAAFFIVYVIFGAAFMIILIRFFKKYGLLFEAMEFILISISSSIVFYAILRFGLGYGQSTFGGAVLGLIFATIKVLATKKGMTMKNAAALMSVAGVGVIFGVSLAVVPAILLLLLLAIYDYLSVFISKHMVEMAEFVVEKNLAFTITAIEPAKAGMEESRIDLGTGDMIAPVMMEVSAMTLSPIAGAFVFAGAVTSMGIFLYMIRKRKVVLPALPPVVAGMILALLIGYGLKLY